jgi:hypothetical protein
MSRAQLSQAQLLCHHTEPIGIKQNPIVSSKILSDFIGRPTKSDPKDPLAIPSLGFEYHINSENPQDICFSLKSSTYFIGVDHLP